MTAPEQLLGRQKFSLTYRKTIDDEATLSEADPTTQHELCSSIRGYILNINHRYTTFTNPIMLFEWDMHDLWYQVTCAAKVIDADDAMQDRLVGMVMWAREFGTLRRITTGVEGGEEAVTGDGGGKRIWSDLPFLVGDLTETWEGKGMGMSAKHRRDFAAFTARCVALGVGGVEMAGCALWVLKEALEVPRRIGGVADVGELELSVGEFLGACVAWFECASHRLLTLSVENQEFEGTAGEPGELAGKAGVEMAGFSMGRWLFWRQRFKDIARCGDEELEKEGRKGFGYIVNCGIEMGYEIPGEAKYRARVEKALTEELRRSGKNCVSDQDIVIDLDWTE